MNARCSLVSAPILSSCLPLLIHALSHLREEIWNKCQLGAIRWHRKHKGEEKESPCFHGA